MCDMCGVCVQSLDVRAEMTTGMRGSLVSGKHGDRDEQGQGEHCPSGGHTRSTIFTHIVDTLALTEIRSL